MAMDRRKLKHGGNATVLIIAVVGIVVVLNAVADNRFERWDWTGSKLYSLSDKTVKTLGALKSDVDVTVLLQPGSTEFEQVSEILNNYRSKSPHIHLEYLDPAREPARVGQMLKKFGIDPKGDSTAVVVSAGDRSRHIAVSDLIDIDYSEAAMGGAPRIKGFKGEAAFTGAILSVTESKQTTVCFLKGHDEVSMDEPGPRGLSGFVEALKRENMKVESTDVLGKAPLPAECGLLVIAGPARTMTPPEADALGRFIDGGGKLLALLDPPFARDGTLQKLGIEEVLAARGVGLGEDIVLDPSQGLLFASAESFAANDFPPHPITKDLTGTYIVLGLARSAAAIQPPPAGWTVSPLARTTDKGWGERDLVHLDRVEKDPSDLQGPVVLAVAAEKKLEGGKEARMVVIGDSDLAQNQYLGVYANLDFLLNAVNWLAGSSEQIGIAPREPEQVRLMMTGGQERMVMAATLFGMPGLAIVAGVVVWLFRRR